MFHVMLTSIVLSIFLYCVLFYHAFQVKSIHIYFDQVFFNTSSTGCLETFPSTDRWPTVYLWPAYDILVLHFTCQPLSAGSYVFLFKVRTFRTSL